jgi:putative Mg2+ transporter-C (MgtC) family protein
MNETNPIMAQIIIVGQIALAMFLSGLIGYEREVHNKPAGLRTHILVGGSAALFAALGNLVSRWMANSLGTIIVSSDPVRILQAILTGISFLGAGTIIRDTEGKEVHGLTTAASILFVSGIGVAVASEAYIMAIAITALNLFVLYGVDRLEKILRLDKKS